jgi:hypothetical protein
MQRRFATDADGTGGERRATGPAGDYLPAEALASDFLPEEESDELLELLSEEELSDEDDDELSDDEEDEDEDEDESSLLLEEAAAFSDSFSRARLRVP